MEPLFKAGPFALPDESGASGSDRFVGWLRAKPSELGQALDRILPSEVAEGIGVTDWGWVDDLVTAAADDPSTGWLSRAIETTRTDYAEIEAARIAAVEKEDYGRAKTLKGQRTTLTDENLVSFLARRNVLAQVRLPGRRRRTRPVAHRA